jgi:uncharacterized protein with FMN-binding domain
MKNNTGKLIGSIVVFCLAVGGVFGYALYGAGKKSAEQGQQETDTGVAMTATPVDIANADNGSGANSASKNQNQPVAASPSITPADSRKMTVYKDGTYTAVGAYNSPAGSEQVSITVTLQNDIVVSTGARGLATDDTSQRYQRKFVAGYAEQIVGKNIDTIQLDYVSGSSLTPAGFNAALAKIKVSAKA